MEALLKEMMLHNALANVFEQLGTPRFWRSLVMALRQVAPLDNALAVRMWPDAAPVVLEECTFGGPVQADSPVFHYCQGMYLLDPFYQLVKEGASQGLYQLEQIAPDMFRSSEYYLSYFSKEVGQDELQFILPLGDGSYLSLSLGILSRFDHLAIGRLQTVACWVFAAMKKHWQSSQVKGLSAVPSPQIEDQIGQALAHFGGAKLSEREAEIARLTLQGYSSKAVAQQLAISPETVKTHKRKLYTKLGISSHTDLFSQFISELTEEQKKQAL
ncbi:helix-turn-helix transcriptional regulator [Leeia sp. TBRC 13508]|uniref:Helix-turn-helix transcriptional regulator n=1 Tax=Leeia speluncae TaxID=2884804 RepID=A0ABS8D7E2_9NEIS|nr:helix-turn-helix transcriptional regulator [Leeia speluncae]MCB6184052.1 helix-turn-helix transcriptional regulator [Leeia speluncae]